VNKARAFSTKYEDHIGLLHRFAKGGFARLREIGIYIDYEDVFQECCVSFVQAQKTYKPESGFAFSTYMGRSVINNFNSYAEKKIREHLGLGIVHIEEIFDKSSNSDGYDSDPYDYVSMHAGGTDETAHATATLDARRGVPKMTVKARRVIRDLLAPSQALQQKHKAELAHAEFAKSVGENSRVTPKRITLRYLAKHHGIKMESFAAEVASKMGVDIL